MLTFLIVLYHMRFVADIYCHCFLYKQREGNQSQSKCRDRKCLRLLMGEGALLLGHYLAEYDHDGTSYPLIYLMESRHDMLDKDGSYFNMHDYIPTTSFARILFFLVLFASVLRFLYYNAILSVFHVHEMIMFHVLFAHQ